MFVPYSLLIQALFVVFCKRGLPNKHSFFHHDQPPACSRTRLDEKTNTQDSSENDPRSESAQWLQERFKLSRKDVVGTDSSFRVSLMTLDVSVLKKRADWLQDRLALKEKDIVKMVQREPNILKFIPETNLAGKLDFLQERLKWNDAALSKATRSLPQILGLNIEHNIEPKLDFLQERLQWDDATLSKAILSGPSILGLNIETNLEPKLEWLQQRLELNAELTGEVIRKCPGILGYSISENLAPTFEFYEHCIGTKKAQVLLASDPRLFGASLERRLKPRLEEAKKLEFEIDCGMLQRIAKHTEDQWRRSVNYQRKNS